MFLCMRWLAGGKGGSEMLGTFHATLESQRDMQLLEITNSALKEKSDVQKRQRCSVSTFFPQVAALEPLSR
jgi:hypothetical protein